MTTIESATRANAAKIKKSTGAVPGRRTAEQQVVARRDAASADPGQSGQWSAVRDTPVVPVFQAVLPNGKVLMWDSVGDKATGNYPDHTFTRAIVWDPRNRHVPPGECLRLQHLLCRLCAAGGRTRAGRRWE
jgi:hypothetical protein